MTRLHIQPLQDLIATLPDGPDGPTAQAVCRAYDYAGAKMGERERFPGVYATAHGLVVASALNELQADRDTLVAALLHGLKSEEYRHPECQELFGRPTVNILDNLHKLDVYTDTASGSKNQRTLEAIRRAVFTLVEGDLRTVLLRLSLCLCDLHAAASLPEGLKRDLSQDALNIYAPLANRLGIWQLKWQIEDLAFRYLEPEKFNQIAVALVHRRSERDQRVRKALQRLQQELAQEKIAATVSGRPKHIYSIYRKMERKQVGLDNIYDAQALRVIVERDEPEALDLPDEERRKHKYTLCYRVLAVVHNLWTPIASEFDDYIQHPKQNGYRSLHTAVMDEEGHILEVQIRTRKMHDEAERGIAAHWAYKEGSRPSAQAQRQIQSLRQLLGALGSHSSELGDDSGENISEELLGERIYVFSPKRDLFDLPKNATPVDFAYAIHTDVGHRCRGALVNKKIVPLNHKLKTGDEVSIITYPKDTPGRPNREWLNPKSGYTASNHTRNRIRRWFRQHERTQNIELGRRAVEEVLRPYRLTVTVEDIAHQLNENNLDDFWAKVGFGDISRAQIEGALKIVLRERKSHPETSPSPEPEAAPGPPLLPGSAHRGGVQVLGAVGLPVNLAGCCKPIPPEPILGYVTRGRGVTIHHRDCPQVQYKLRHEPERVVPVSWGEHTGSYAVPYNIKAHRDTGLLKRIAETLRGQNINLIKAKATNSSRHTHIYISAQVNDLDQARWIRNKLRDFDTVIEVHSRLLTD